MKYYSYYRQAYGAVLDGLVGQYDIQIAAENAPLFASPVVNADGTADPDRVWVTKYGLKAFSPIAKGFPYQDYDDFGVSRSYGYKRQHLGPGVSPCALGCLGQGIVQAHRRKIHVFPAVPQKRQEHPIGKPGYSICKLRIHRVVLGYSAHAA